LLADVSADVDGQHYFAPLITNGSASDITLEINPGTAAAVRCNCLVSKGAVRTHIGYYRLYQNSSVAATTAPILTSDPTPTGAASLVGSPHRAGRWC